MSNTERIYNEYTGEPKIEKREVQRKPQKQRYLKWTNTIDG